MRPLKLFPRRAERRAEPKASWWVVSCLFLFSPPRSFRIDFQLKVAAVVGASALKLGSTKRGERHREPAAAARRERGREREWEREERSPFPLSDAGRFEGRTWGDAQARRHLHYAQYYSIWCLKRVVTEGRWSSCCRRIFASLGDVATHQDKATACQKFAEKMTCYARRKSSICY